MSDGRTADSETNADLGCRALTDGGAECRSPAVADARLGLCAPHLLAAYEWVLRDVGVTDALPAPCRACGSRLGVRYPSAWLCAVCEWRQGEIPDGDATPPRVDVVYYVESRGRIKIGTSANPRARLAQLSFDRLLAFERGDRLREHARHVQFAAYRIPRSEWFEPNDDLARHVSALAAGIDDPWALHGRWVSEAIALHS